MRKTLIIYSQNSKLFLEKLVVQSSKHLETVLTMLLQIVQDMQLSSKAFAINILETISYMISTARRGRNIFCQVYGFETCLSLFTRFLGDFTNNYNDTKSISILPFILFLIPIFDMTNVIRMRIIRKSSPFLPDKRHLHHQLLKLGLSHKNTVLFIYSICQFNSILTLAIGALGELGVYPKVFA